MMRNGRCWLPKLPENICRIILKFVITLQPMPNPLECTWFRESHGPGVGWPPQPVENPPRFVYKLSW